MDGRSAIVGFVVCVALVLSAAPARAQRVRWDDVRGIPLAGNVVGTGTGAVTGGGLPWSTSGGQARADLSGGNLQFHVRGLVLGGGGSVGTRAGVSMVKGTLVCDTNGSAGGNSELVDTPLVPLDEQGNARFRGNVGPLPTVCASEPDIAFLVRTGSGAWLAYGAVRRP
jgi:hypothetical protein